MITQNITFAERLKLLLKEHHPTATGCNWLYRITQCYLLPETSKHALR